MKTTRTIRRWCIGGAIALAAELAVIYAINVCMEGGPHYSAWSCTKAGGAATLGTLDRTTVNVTVGQTVIPPVLVTPPIFTNGTKQRLVYYDCSPGQNNNQFAPIYYSPGALYFSPPISNLYTAPGTYLVTAKVDAA